MGGVNITPVDLESLAEVEETVETPVEIVSADAAKEE